MFRILKYYVIFFFDIENWDSQQGRDSYLKLDNYYIIFEISWNQQIAEWETKDIEHVIIRLVKIEQIVNNLSISINQKGKDKVPVVTLYPNWNYKSVIF